MAWLGEARRCKARLGGVRPGTARQGLARRGMAWQGKGSNKNSTSFYTVVLFLFDRGGEALGLGTYRGLFGKFTVTQWE